MVKNKMKVSIDASKKGPTLKDTAEKLAKDVRYRERQEDRKAAKERWSGKNDMDHAYRGPNDINWRNKVSSLMSLAARIPFGQPLGLVQSREMNSLGDLSSQAIPGILGVRCILGAGQSKDYNSPLNLAVRKSYSYIRHANSGSKNYEAADLGLYYLAVGQALALLGWLKRIYVHAMSFSATNRYWPEVILRSNRVDYTDIRANLPNLAYLIGWFSNAIGSLAFPKFSYFELAEDAFLHVYRDSESPKEQLYMYIPYDFGIYNPVFASTGGAVEYTGIFSTVAGTGATFANLSTMVHTIMDVLLGDEDIGIISGDILKAYGEDRYIPRSVTVAEIATPIYSVEILEQIHNVQITNASLTNYHQNPGSTSTAPFIEVSMVASTFTFDKSSDHEIPYDGLTELDAFGRDPNVDEVLNCCTFKNKSKVQITAGQSGTWNVVASDPTFEAMYPRDIVIYTGVGANMTFVTSVGLGSADLLINSDETNSFHSSGHALVESIKASNFDWAPITRTIDENDAIFVLGDVHNMTFIDYEHLSRIHEAALLSLFGFTDTSAK